METDNFYRLLVSVSIAVVAGFTLSPILTGAQIEQTTKPTIANMGAKRPNILFFVSEHHRWDWLGFYGKEPVRTPTIDKLARDGMVFRQCRVNSPLCGPSRASLAAGMRYHNVGVPDNYADFDPTRSTFMKELRNAGYRVAVIGKSDLHKKSHLHGIDGWSERLGQLGFTDAIDMGGKRDSAWVKGREKPIEPYMAWLHKEGLADTVLNDLDRRSYRDANPVKSGQGIATEPLPVSRKYQADDFVGERSREMLHGFPRNAPWFLQINWGSAHPPFDAVAELLSRYQDTVFSDPVDSDDAFTDHQAVRRQYAAMIEGMDEWMGRIIEAVAARGELENTIIVLSADHGDMLGDKGLWNKSHPFDPAIHVPLVIQGPGVRASVQTNALVELMDLAATFVDLARLPVPANWDARSLVAVLKGDSEAHRDITIAELPNFRLAFDGRYKYIESPKETPAALYDLIADPDERTNLLSAQPGLARLLRERLANEVSKIP